MKEENSLPSNRSVGIIFVVFFLILSLWRLWSGDKFGWLWLSLSFLMLTLTLFFESSLTPLNRAWMKFGKLLHRIINPVVMAFMFFGLITPIAICLRIIGRDSLLRRYDPKASSYWIVREPPGPAQDSLPRQY